jgi:hypothetical protein
MDSFGVLGLTEPCNERDILRAWRRLARKHHSDKTGVCGDDKHMQALNEAKDLCLKTVIKQSYTADEQEFAMHICKVLTQKMERECDVHIDLCTEGGIDIIQSTLREFYWIRTVDAMEWILHCAMGDMPFDQDKEDEIPILCRYYNDFIGLDRWSEKDHTMMKVLNKYDNLKAGRYGNFARFIEK